MIQFKAWLRYFSQQIGMLGILGLVSFACIPIYYLAIIKPLHLTSLDLQRQYAESQQHGTYAGIVTAAQVSQQEKLSAYYSFFPLSDHIAGWLGKIYEHADNERLRLPHGEYRPASNHDKNPTELHIVLPVHGSYEQIHKFVISTMADIPFIALDQITFQRTQNGELEAQVSFTLFIRKG